MVASLISFRLVASNLQLSMLLCFESSASFSVLRPHAITVSPICAYLIASCSPMPDVAPVIKVTIISPPSYQCN